MGKIIDCETIAEQYFTEVEQELKSIGVRPIVKMFLATDDDSCVSYATIMRRKFAKTGIEALLFRISSSEELEEGIRATEGERETTGCFVFYPIKFPGFENYYFMKLVPPSKDVEGLSAENVYRLIHYRKTFENTPCKAVVPCTPKAVIKVLQNYNVHTEGSDVVIVNKSYALGDPLRMMFDNLRATVTVCDINTKPESLRYYVKNADIIVTGVPYEVELFNDEDIKQGATVINCSFYHNFDPEKIARRAEFISFRQGKNYIGQVTTAMAAINVLYLLKYQRYRESR
ncbi:bifunctional 5,10-methylenetetrahydrofolate dehydrogenase/5,10-methenyltetrahydrofolate cyclohydrolase [Candidatus Woesearchaeota archaeon]|nr:bifunctional 5,10-methylenetetrahydrofolate dehydrogenase/5,10-methenyltetrahydrofolate cyclohydrolase [Candidatus Woesearchaeota archaeon]